jgi:hypothetical protein
VLTEHCPLGLGSGNQLLPHRAISIYWRRYVGKLPYRV